MNPETASKTNLVRHWPVRWEICFVAAFTAVYAAAVIPIAVQKPLWIDEVVTLRLSTLPTLHDIWAALCAGADTAPPAVYILTRLACAIGGPTPLAARLPAIAGYWCMSIGVFYFVKRWAGSALAAFSVFLIGVTLAFSYATEARAYAPLLGAFSISLLCWQRATAGENRAIWLPALALSTALAASFHFYAPVIYIPLFLAELARTARLRRIDWGVWIALIAGMSIILAYLPILRGVARANLKSANSPNYWAAATLSALIDAYQRLFQFLIIPAAVAAAVILAIAAYVDSSRDFERRRVPIEYTALASGLVLFPGILFVVCRIVHGAYYERYLLSTLIGVALLSVIFIGRLPGFRLATPWLTILLGLVFVFRLWLAVRHVDDIAEIGVIRNIIESTTSEGLPVVVAAPLDFMAFINNPPGDVQRRVYYLIAPESAYQNADRTGELGILVILPWVHIERVVRLDDFLSKHRDFIVYSRGTRSEMVVPELLRRGVPLRFIRRDVLRATLPPAQVPGGRP